MQKRIRKSLQFRWLTLVVVAGILLGLSVPGVFAKEATSPAKAAQAKAPAALVDLNTADQKALEALPGVGPKTAQEIIKGRPYNSVDELSKVKGIDKGKMGALKSLVTVSAPKAAAPSAPAAPPVSAAPTKGVPAPKVATPSVPATPTVPTAPTKGVPVTKASEAASKAASTKLAPGEKVNINTASKEQIEKLPGIGPVKAQAIIAGRPYASVDDVMKVKGIKEGSFSKIKDLITVK